MGGCCVHSWSRYDVGLYMDLCLGHSIFVLWHNHTIFESWVYHHGTMCQTHSWTLQDLDLRPQFQNYFHLEFVFEQDFLRHRRTKFGTWMYHHKRTCCVICDLCMTFTFVWMAGVSVVSFYLVLFPVRKQTLLQSWENHCRLSSLRRGHELYGSTWSDLHVVMFTILRIVFPCDSSYTTHRSV